MDFNNEIVLIGITIVATAIISISFQRKFNNKKAHYKSKRGIKLENKAAHFLKKNGYTILSHHKNLSYTLKENNKEVGIKIETDYTVSKNGRDFLVEVKSGEHTSHIKYASTRRQLLEYYCASNYDGYLLVDMHNYSITEIEFPFKKSDNNAHKKIIAIILFAFLLGSTVLLPVYLYKYPIVILSVIIATKSKSIYAWVQS